MILTETDAEADMGHVNAVEVEDAGPLEFDYLRLGDEDFERLIYALAKNSAPEGIGRTWDGATLMVRGADAGRDVLLTNQSQAIGVVQCKRLESRLALPAVFREIAKFILFASATGDLHFDKKLVYMLAVARDPATTVVDFFARRSELEPKKVDEIKAAAREMRDSYETIKNFSDSEAEQTVLGALQNLELHLLRPTELDEWMGRETSVSQRFFRQRVVVDNQVVRQGQADIMDALAGLTGKVAALEPVTDADLKILRGYIEDTPESHRLNVGIAMLFGFPREMYVGESNLQPRLNRLALVLSEIGKDYTDWVFADARQRADEINGNRNAGVIAPFASQIPLRFLTLIAKECLSEALSGSAMNDIIDKLTNTPKFDDDEARLQHVRDELLAEGKRYLQEDFSQLAGDSALIAEKRKLIAFMMEGMKETKDIEAAVNIAIDFWKPTLFTAATAMRTMYKHKTTIVLTGNRGIDSAEALQRFSDTIRALDESHSGIA